MMIELQVFILTRDRPHLLFQAIDSLLKEMPNNVELVVSDNSVGNETEHLMVDIKECKYVRRIPPLPVEQHFGIVIEECISKYLILFHDDDMVTPEFVRVLLDAMKSDKNAAAAGCNAYIIKGSKKTSRKMMGFLSHKYLIKTSSELFKPYFGFGPYEPPAFPGYIYRSSILKKTGLVRDCGKHSDVTTLDRILTFGHIIWLPECLMYYRYHESNDGATFSVGDRLKLMRYAISRRILEKTSDDIRDYRIRMYAQWLKSAIRTSSVRKHIWRTTIIINFILSNIFPLLFSKRFFLRILSRQSWL